MRKTNLLLIITLTLLALSCKKDAVVSKKDLLSGKNWVLISESISPAMNVGGVLVTDLYAQKEGCDKDDIYKFTATGTYTFEEGPSKCDVSFPQVYETGTWTFNSNETILVTTSSTGVVTNSKILELTATKVISTSETTSDGIIYTITSTYQKS